jgi:uncharacterized protein YndB with AHSA1/START domain
MNDMTPAADAARTLSASRVIDATPQAIWAALSDPSRLALWWGPHGFTNTFDVFEFRPGGRWRFTMHGPDGKNYENDSVFVALDAPRRAVIDHISAPRFELTVDLEDLGGRTRVVWTQVFETAELRDAIRPRADPGNQQNLERLAAHLAAQKG